MIYAGIDLGGTGIKAALVDSQGRILRKKTVPTGASRPWQEIAADMNALVKDLAEDKGIGLKEIAGVGLGVPGAVDLERGELIYAPNLPTCRHTPFRRCVEEALGIPLYLDNDANVAALGEMWKGAGHGEKNMVMVTLGTGVGGGGIMGGRPLIGANGAGGEIGHICVNYFEEKCCGCGKKGCLEQYASATGIARIAREHLAADKKDSILRTYDLDKIDAKIVFDALKEGDQLAVDVVEEFGEYLAKGLADVAVVVDPSLFVIGGGVSKAGEILLTYIEKYYRKRAFFANKDTQFAIASLGNDAGICGAAKLILDSQV